MNKFRIQALNMNKSFLSIITILMITAMVFTACNRGTQQQTEPSLQILTGDLSAFAESESEENLINFFENPINIFENPINIWGWSKDGKVGISEFMDSNRGGVRIRAFVLDTVSDAILWEQSVGFYQDEGYNGIPEKETNAFFNNFHNICRQQFGITIKEGSVVVPIKIWGWSKDGIAGISEFEDKGNRGDPRIRAFVLNVVSNTILWEQKIDAYNFDDEGFRAIPEIEMNAFFNNFHNICRQQFGIDIQEGILLDPSTTVFRHNEKIFNVIINADIDEETDSTRAYSVIVETDDRRKTIFSTDDHLPFLPVFYRYNVSPFEERALIIVRCRRISQGYSFEYAGCHLTAGF